MERRNELEVERLTLREPNGGRVRAVLETLPPADKENGSMALVVRLSLLAPNGEPTFVAQVDERGEPGLSIGHPDRGVSLILTREAIEGWASGDCQVVMTTKDDRGEVLIRQDDGSLRALGSGGA